MMLVVINRVESFIERFEERKYSEPFACQASRQLLEVGITIFREYNFDKFRLLYRAIKIDEKIIVIGDTRRCCLNGFPIIVKKPSVKTGQAIVVNRPS